MTRNQSKKARISPTAIIEHSKFCYMCIYSTRGLCFLLSVFTTFVCNAQINVLSGPSYTADVLAETIAGEGIEISGASLTCYNQGKGVFECVDCNVGFESGIILTSGQADLAEGPNNLASAGYIVPPYGGSDASLDSILGYIGTNDACVLEFDLIPNSDTITFDYVFGSEEYLEFVASSYNDIFGFFISGPGISGNQNIALIPGTSTPVSINNINSTSYSSYYNINGDGYTSPYYDSSYYIQYDGFTDVLQARSAVTPCETYHLKIAIADVGDESYDSGVFIRENSLNTNLGFIAATELASSGDTIYLEPGTYIDLEVVASTSLFSFTWSPATGLSTTTGSTTTAFFTSEITYTVTATDCGTAEGTITLTPFPTILPVTISETNISCNNGYVSINWKTESEINTDEFIIERSDDGYSFYFAGSVSAAGSSQSNIEYEWKDDVPATIQTYYKLSLIDKDGKTSFTKILETQCSGFNNEDVINSYSLSQSHLLVDYTSINGGEYELILFDITGKKVIEEKLEMEAGLNSIQLPAKQSVSENIYILYVYEVIGGSYKILRLLKR